MRRCGASSLLPSRIKRQPGRQLAREVGWRGRGGVRGGKKDPARIARLDGGKYLLTFPLFLGMFATVYFVKWYGRVRKVVRKETEKKSCRVGKVVSEGLLVWCVCVFPGLGLFPSVCGVRVRKVGCCGDEWHFIFNAIGTEAGPHPISVMGWTKPPAALPLTCFLLALGAYNSAYYH